MYYVHIKRLAHLTQKITNVLIQYSMWIPVLTKTESLKQYFAILNLLIFSVTDKYSKNLYTKWLAQTIQIFKKSCWF